MDSKSMYIYLKKEGLEEVAKKDGDLWYLYNNIVIYSYELCPHISIEEDMNILVENENLKKLFLKATIVAFPDYTKKNNGHEREYGVYEFGKVKGKLTPSANSKYCLKLETTEWEGLIDMVTIQEKLWEGVIPPTISYENKQVKNNYFFNLRQSIKNFFLVFKKEMKESQ